jgi:hypothetical protein
LQVTRFPDPPAEAVLSTECLLDKIVIFKHFLYFALCRTPRHFIFDCLQCLIHILQRSLLIQQPQQVLDAALEKQFLLAVFNLLAELLSESRQFLVGHFLLRLINGLAVLLPD